MSTSEVARFAVKLAKFMNFADSLAELSTCKRLIVGAVIFPPDCSRVLSIGYNGPRRGVPNESCSNSEGDCGCAHAEVNALLKLDVHSVWPAFLYTTLSPCAACANAIVNSGAIVAVIYDKTYRSTAGLQMLMASNVLTVERRRLEVSVDSLLKWRAACRAC